MPKCAKCDRDYDSAYDACPHCARQSSANVGRWWLLGMLLATLVSAFVMPYLAIVFGLITVILGIVLGIKSFAGGVKEGLSDK
jgi:hypothetical protein